MYACDDASNLVPPARAVRRLRNLRPFADAQGNQRSSVEPSFSVRHALRDTAGDASNLNHPAQHEPDRVDLRLVETSTVLPHQTTTTDRLELITHRETRFT